MLARSQDGVNPFEGFTPSVPTGQSLDPSSEEFLKMEAAGLSAVSETGFILVAGGLGERLGYQGIKVSLPLASSKIDKSAEGAGRALGMVYDAERSFQAFLDLEADDVPNMAVLTRLVATEGEAGGVTAYMDARREGDDLLIFVDKVIAPPKQKW